MTPRRIGSNLVLLAASCLFAVLAVEGGLRLLLEPDRLVPNDPSKPALNERRNALRFYAENRDRAADSFSQHDPWLGWDSAYGSSRARGLDRIPPKSGRRAVALGDSFVYGNEVAADENFAALLDRADNGLEVLNLGVPGYGMDQSWLKFERYGAALDPDVVLFGIYVSDYERATVAFTAGAKPRFRTVDGRVLITNLPVPSPAESLRQIGLSLAGRSWAFDFFRYRLAALPDTSVEYFADGDRIAAHILESLARALLPRQELLIVHIPRGESFTGDDPFDAAMSAHLLALYRAMNLPFLDLAEVFLAHTPAAEVAGRYYVVRAGGSVGHLNREGHRAAAAAIARTLALPTL